jgi:hypothetical protein
MKRIILIALALSVSAFAQVPKERTTKLVSVKYVAPEAIHSMVRTFGVDVQMNSALKTMSLSGFPENIAAAEAAIKQLDVAPKNIELVVNFLVGSNQTTTAGAVPAELRDVVAQLKSAFTFKDYSMLDTLTLRTRAGSAADTTGIIANPSASSIPRLTQFSIRSASVTDDGVIRIDRMHAGLRIPIPSAQKVDYVNTGIDQDVDVKEGQKIVVGRASLEGPEKALFLVLTAKVVQ